MRPIAMSAMLGLPLFGIAQPRTGISAAANPHPAPPTLASASLDTLCPVQHRRDVPAPGLPAGPPLSRAAAAAGKDNA